VSATPITVTFVYATRERQVLREMALPAGATVAEAIASAEAALGPDVMSVADKGDVGVWGRRVGPEGILRDGDRLEFLRPLTADPMDARRRREAVRRRNE